MIIESNVRVQNIMWDEVKKFILYLESIFHQKELNF